MNQINTEVELLKQRVIELEQVVLVRLAAPSPTAAEVANAIICTCLRWAFLIIICPILWTYSPDFLGTVSPVLALMGLFAPLALTWGYLVGPRDLGSLIRHLAQGLCNAFAKFPKR